MTKINAPERIIVCTDGHKPAIADWAKDKMKECDVEYVRADLLAAKVKEEREAALTKTEEAVWVATRDFKGILNELQRRAIALAVVEHLKTNENQDEKRRVENDTRLA